MEGTKSFRISSSEHTEPRVNNRSILSAADRYMFNALLEAQVNAFLETTFISNKHQYALLACPLYKLPIKEHGNHIELLIRVTNSTIGCNVCIAFDSWRRKSALLRSYSLPAPLSPLHPMSQVYASGALPSSFPRHLLPTLCSRSASCSPPAHTYCFYFFLCKELLWHKIQRTNTLEVEKCITVLQLFVYLFNDPSPQHKK